MAQRATLINPQTGQRIAVDVGSQEAQRYFGQGYQLETQAPTQTPTGTTGAFQFPSFAEYARQPNSPLSDLEERLKQQQDLYQTFIQEQPAKEQGIRQDIVGQYPQAERYANEQTRLGEELSNLYTKPTSELYSDINDPTVRIALRDQRANYLERQLTNVGIIQKTEQLGREDLIDRRQQDLLAQLASIEFGISNTSDALNMLQSEYMTSYQTAYNTALQNFQAQEQRAAEQRSLEQSKELARFQQSITPRNRNTAMIENADGTQSLIDANTGEIIQTYGSGHVLSKEEFAQQYQQQQGQSLTPEAIDSAYNDYINSSGGDERSILNSIISDLPTGQQDGAYGAIASFQNAKDIIDLINQGTKTGPLEKYRVGARQMIGNSSEEQNKLIAAMTAFSANYIKGISGVAVSEQEYKRLMKALPSIGKQESVNIDVLKGLLKTLQNKYEAQIGINFSDYPNSIPVLDSPADKPPLSSFIE